MSDVKTEERKSSAEIKKEIETAQRAAKEQKTKTELVNSGLPLAAIADRINANSTTENPKPESKSEPAQAPAQPATERAAAPQESVELNEWKKKKGISWDTPDSVAIELRKLDQEFHRKRVEDKRRESEQRPPVAPAWTPPPQNYQPSFPQNNYPASAPNQRMIAEQLARQYNMLPDDFEKIVSVQRDLTAAMLAQERQRHEQELDGMKRENIKNSEFRELSADPVFRRPEVAKEFHDVLEQIQGSDPESFSQDPYAYRKAFDRALQNIGRRKLEGSFQEIGDPGFQLPKNPPKPLGQGAGGGREANENGITQAEFDRLSAGDKRLVLERMGLVQQKY